MNWAFSTNVLKTFFPIFQQESKKIVKKIEENFPNEEKFNLQEIVEEMVINSIGITVFDLRDKIQLAKKIKVNVDE